MDKWDKLLDYVTKEEDRYYELANKALDKGNLLGNQLMSAQATVFQRVRYVMQNSSERSE